MTHSRLNILIGLPMDGAGSALGDRFTGLSLHVRDGYVPLTMVVPMRTIFDPDAINSARRRGAFRVDVDVPAIEAALARLHAAWGDIPVQDNSGHCPHLATAPGVLII